MKTFYYCALAVVALSLASAGGCSRNPVTGKMQLDLISLDQEVAMGDQAAPEFEAEFDDKVNNPVLQAYVREIGAKLAAVSHRQEVTYRYALLRSKTPNAFALPGGRIYVTAGLMTRMTNERQLAAVLGHETIHVAAEHNVQGLQKQMGVEMLASLAGKVIGGTAGEVAEVGTKIAGSMAVLSYGREDELEADSYGVRYMTKAGYNPYGMVELLAVLQSLSDAEEPGRIGAMMQSHPLTSERIEEAKETIDDLPGEHSPRAADPRAAAFLGMRTLLRRELGW